MLQMSEKILAQIAWSRQVSSLENGFTPCSLDIISRSPIFILESLPPTATAAKFNSYRAYRALQQRSVTICL